MFMSFQAFFHAVIFLLPLLTIDMDCSVRFHSLNLLA